MKKKYDFTDGDFLNDEEKMLDFFELSKKEFLESYSYLTEEEYDNTMKKFTRAEIEFIQIEVLKIDGVLFQVGDNIGLFVNDELIEGKIIYFNKDMLFVLTNDGELSFNYNEIQEAWR